MGISTLCDRFSRTNHSARVTFSFPLWSAHVARKSSDPSKIIVRWAVISKISVKVPRSCVAFISWISRSASPAAVVNLLSSVMRIVRVSGS
jgi:hypothetical protein